MALILQWVTSLFRALARIRGVTLPPSIVASAEHRPHPRESPRRQRDKRFACLGLRALVRDRESPPRCFDVLRSCNKSLRDAHRLQPEAA
jgi:hypothetical protein